MYNPLLMIDFYKATHSSMYPRFEDGSPRMALIYSPYTPRMSRLEDINQVCYFGGQGFCKEFLIDAFNDNFFNRPEEEIVNEYTRVLTYTLGKGTYDAEKVRALHRLGYLPIAMYAVPEGTRTAIGVPQSVLVNTHPDFAWLTNTLETAYSSYMWHTQISAEVGIRYRKIVQKYRDLTCDESVRVASLLGDFSMRGQHSPESAMRSSAAWLLSFRNTATIPAIMWMEDNYNCNIEKEEVGFGAISTEHSVMCSNMAIDGNEAAMIKRLLTEIYPHNSFSMVSDSYDYWNLVNNILPQCRNEIMNHDGCLLIRGDSGDPVEIIAGKKIEWIYDEEYEPEHLFVDNDTTVDWLSDYCRSTDIETDTVLYFNYRDSFYQVKVYPEIISERGACTDSKYYYVENYTFDWEQIDPSAELLGTVWALWDQFGGSLNTRGFKVLDPHVKALYGDSITPQRCEEIYQRLTDQGFAISNVSLGVGSFSFMCVETVDDDGISHFGPYTRDTFGIAIKATYGETKDGLKLMIHKEPKALSWKKSQKGCCIVSPDGQSYTDGHTFEEAHGEGVENLLELVFKDGKMVKEQSLAEIRNRLYPGGF